MRPAKVLRPTHVGRVAVTTAGCLLLLNKGMVWRTVLWAHPMSFLICVYQTDRSDGDRRQTEDMNTFAHAGEQLLLCVYSVVEATNARKALSGVCP